MYTISSQGVHCGVSTRPLRHSIALGLCPSLLSPLSPLPSPLSPVGKMEQQDAKVSREVWRVGGGERKEGRKEEREEGRKGGRSGKVEISLITLV